MNRLANRLATGIRNIYLSPPVRLFIHTGKFLCAGHLFITHFYSWGSVSGPSMLPYWEIWGHGALISYTYRHGRGIKVGDLVKLKVPTTKAEAIKRVAGLPGDYVLVHTPGTAHEEMIQVPQGHCWVLGDNLADSKDSRIYGPLPMALIDGKVIYKTGFWPWQLSRVVNPLEEQRGSSG